MVLEVPVNGLSSFRFPKQTTLPRFDRYGLMASVYFDPRFPAIGPHEGREAYLLAMGWKPAALFGDVVGVPPSPEEHEVAKLVETGQLESHTFRFPELHGPSHIYVIRYTVYFPTGYSDACHSMESLLSCQALTRDSPPINPEITIGRTLGYCDGDIFAFILRFARLV